MIIILILSYIIPGVISTIIVTKSKANDSIELKIKKYMTLLALVPLINLLMLIVLIGLVVYIELKPKLKSLFNKYYNFLNRE